MAYTVLARKYRSRTFEEVIGQEPIATTLVNAIKVGRIHHGYLFTGTRGVGKTSMARILAKALNCLNSDGPTTTPCCECDACRSVAEGDDVDVLEIDAASNTGVDNIRELRSNTAYRPARSRFKVYIIDEVHMLSTGAFNALLKTLEEPPDHVKFILATTEIQKVPATIRSRCQNFNFRNIGPDAIAKRLKEIVQAEEAKAEDVVVQRVARLAAGSMRDALSILDQLLSVSPTKLDAKVLDEILPPAQDEQIFALLRYAAEGDAPAVLKGFDALVAAGRGLENFCNDAIEIVRTLMLIQACGADTSLVDVPAGARDDYVALSRQFELSHYVQMIAMLEELRRNVRYSGAGRALTEALLVRLAKMRQWASIEQLLQQLPASGGQGTSEKKKAVADAEPGRVDQPEVAPTDIAAGLHTGRETAANETRPQETPTAATGVVTQRSAPAATVTQSGGSPPLPLPEEPAWREASPEVYDQARQDPMVRQILEQFDGTLIKVRTRAVRSTRPTVEESCSETSDNS